MSDAEPATDVSEVAAEKKRKPHLGLSYWKLWTASVTSNLGDGIAQIAYPWLASAVTRDPVLIALIAVAQRLPWLVFTLPAGVITDRVDRRKIMVWMDVVRTILTLGVGFAVIASESSLPTPDEIAGGFDIATNYGLYIGAGGCLPAVRVRRGPARQRGADDPACHRRTRGPREWPTAGCGAPRWSPTASSARRSGRC